MAQFVNELEDIFQAIHAGIREDYAVALPAIAYNLCVSLGYEECKKWINPVKPYSSRCL